MTTDRRRRIRAATMAEMREAARALLVADGESAAAEETADEIRALGVTCDLVRGNLADPEDLVAPSPACTLPTPESLGAAESFTATYSTDRTMFVRVRDGGASPIKTFETTAVFGSGGGSATAIRTADD